ncbi:MAG: substrate-binding domain-containing protein, partial [Aestuariivirga sp.]
ALYNHQLPQSTLKSKPPMQTMKDWHTSHPHLFNKRPYDRAGCDKPDITAFICFSDTLAFGAIEEIQRCGFKVPDDISVTGFDDSIAATVETGAPALTTVHQDAFEKGRQAALALLGGGEGGSKIVNIPASLMIRGSTAPVGDCKNG